MGSIVLGEKKVTEEEILNDDDLWRLSDEEVDDSKTMTTGSFYDA